MTEHEPVYGRQPFTDWEHHETTNRHLGATNLQMMFIFTSTYAQSQQGYQTYSDTVHGCVCVYRLVGSGTSSRAAMQLKAEAITLDKFCCIVHSQL